ncbi:MAG: hypothetical protein ACYTGZ_17040 [Planctomycetota bacterium]|jgi:hypothetical protein
MRILALLSVLFLSLGGCLDYEIKVETVISEGGEAKRVIFIRENSDAKKTWYRYAPPGAPYQLKGDDAEGFTARTTLKPGSHKSGIRVLRDDWEGDRYIGAESTKDRVTFDGSVRIAADDILVGKLYEYRETIDVGIDTARFRKGVPFAIEMGTEILIGALELVEPKRDFGPVRENAKKVIVPKVSRAALAIHGQLQLMEVNNPAGLWKRPLDDLLADPHVKVILAELERIGVQRTAGAPATKDAAEYFDPDNWTIQGTLWKEFLAPLKGVDAELRKKLWTALEVAGEEDDDEVKVEVQEDPEKGPHGEEPEDDEEDGDDEEEEGAQTLWLRALNKAFHAGAQGTLQKEIREILRAGIGAHVVNDLFDSHSFEMTVRMPGRLLRTNGFIGEGASVRWRIGEGSVSNPRLFAFSIVRSDLWVGRIVNMGALLDFRDEYRKAGKDHRDTVASYLQRAKNDGFKKAQETFGDDIPAIAALKKAIGD